MNNSAPLIIVTYEDITRPRGVGVYIRHEISFIKTTRPIIVIYRGEADKRYTHDGVDYISVKSGNSGPFGILKFQWRIYKMLRNIKETTINFHETAGFVYSILPRRRNKIIVTFYHSHAREAKSIIEKPHRTWRETMTGIFMKISGWEQRLVCRQADRSVTISQVSQQDLIQAGISVDKIMKTACAIPSYNPSNPQNIRTPYSFLSVGGLEWRKRLDVAICALAQAKLPSFIYHIVGAGPEKKYLQSLARQLNISGSVIFHGYVSDQDKEKLYDSCGYFLYPSEVEGFGIVPLEALSRGMVVIAADIPVLKEVLNGASRYFPVNQPTVLAEIFRCLPATPPAPAADVASVLAKYDPEKLSYEYHQAYGTI